LTASLLFHIKVLTQYKVDGSVWYFALP